MYKLIVSGNVEIPESQMMEVEKKTMAKAIKDALIELGFKVTVSKDVEL